MATALRQRAAIGAALLSLWACGSAAPPVPQTTAAELDLVRRGQGAVPAFAVITRPSGEITQLSLWIDAGARDADPPQLATLAAWLAADAAGEGVSGRAWPDGIELSLACRRNELDACLGRLARGLALRAPAPARVEAMRARLIEARRRAAAGDPQRRADLLALQALYGGRAAGMFPLGVASDDARADAGASRAFLARHFGSGHALLVAAGEITNDTLARAARRAFARAPQAPGPRRVAASPADPGDDAVQVAVDDAPALSFALAGANLASVEAAARALRARLEREALARAVRGHVFAVRGAALGLLRVDSDQPEAVVRAAAHELERLRREGTKPAPDAPSGGDLVTLARRLGSRWSARGPVRAAALALGVGVLVAGGRADRVQLDDPDAPLRTAWQARLRDAWRAGQALADPKLSGELDQDAASVTLDNGVRIEVRRRNGEQLAASVRFGCGGRDDPPLLHGRTALLATLGTTACAGLDPPHLSARLQALGAQLLPRADGESFGLLLTAPARRWQPALELALQCALHPALERSALAAARLRLRDRLGPPGGAGELLAVLGERLAPNQPGALAPWGSPVRQASVGLPELREQFRGCRQGGALSVAVVGEIPARQSAVWAGRRLALVPQGKAALDPVPKTPAAAPAAAGATTPPEQPTLGLAVWRAALPDADPAGARGFAALMRATLEQAPGVSATWQDGGLSADGAWAAVALRGEPAALDAVAASLGQSARGLPAASLQRAADRAFELSEETRARRAGSPSAEAEALARQAFGVSAPAAASREAARALAQRLKQSEPLWLPIR